MGRIAVRAYRNGSYWLFPLLHVGYFINGAPSSIAGYAQHKSMHIILGRLSFERGVNGGEFLQTPHAIAERVRIVVVGRDETTLPGS